MAHLSSGRQYKATIEHSEYESGFALEEQIESIDLQGITVMKRLTSAVFVVYGDEG
jgi:hypothetical protein